MKMKPVFSFIVLFLLHNPWGFSEVNDDLPLLQVTPHLYLISGDGGNVVFLTTEEGVLVVDSKMFPYHGEMVVSKIKKMTDQKIKYLIYTHYHGDHIQGAQSFPSSTVIIAHKNTFKNIETIGPSRIKADKTLHFPRQLQDIQSNIEKLKSERSSHLEKAEKDLQIMKKRIEDYERLKLIYPHITFETNISVTLGEQKVELIYLGEAHTDGDILVYFPQEKTIHMGDALLYFEQTGSMNKNRMMERVNKMTDGEIIEIIQTLESWTRLLETVAKIEGIENYIPGHGIVMDRNSFLAQTKYLKNLKTQVSEHQKGRIKHEACSEQGRVLL